MFKTLRRRLLGNTAKRSSDAAYQAAGRGRAFYKWFASGSGANSALLGGLSIMRARSRDLARNNPWCVSALDSLVANITDPGIMPISRAADKKFRRDARRLWTDWGVYADAAGVLSWDLLVGLAARSLFESGEVFVRMRPRRPSDGLPVPMQVQIIEADHCPIEHTVDADNGNKIIAGIEFDKLGKRVAYWMYPEHPGESAQNQQFSGAALKRIPADEIIHLYEPTRPGQIRGTPRLTAVIKRLYDLHEYEDAELKKKKIASMFVGSIESPAVDEDLLDEEEGLDDQQNVNWANIEPGTILTLEPGEELKFSNPPAADASYEPHIKMQLRAVASAIGITYEQLTGDLTGVNFSSIRAGLNEFQRRARRLQRLIAHQLCQRVWDVWLETAVLSGALSAPGFASARSEWARVEWRAPGWRYVNPQQEVAAIKEEIKGGLNSRVAVLAEQGKDVVEIDEQNFEDKERADELGLKYDTDGVEAPAAAGGMGAPQLDGEDEAPEPDPDDEKPTRGRMNDYIRRKLDRVTQQQEAELDATLEEILGGGDGSA